MIFKLAAPPKFSMFLSLLMAIWSIFWVQYPVQSQMQRKHPLNEKKEAKRVQFELETILPYVKMKSDVDAALNNCPADALEYLRSTQWISQTELKITMNPAYKLIPQPHNRLFAPNPILVCLLYRDDELGISGVGIRPWGLSAFGSLYNIKYEVQFHDASHMSINKIK